MEKGLCCSNNPAAEPFFISTISKLYALIALFHVHNQFSAHLDERPAIAPLYLF
jgi:hypothetical protein